MVGRWWGGGLVVDRLDNHQINDKEVTEVQLHTLGWYAGGGGGGGW